MLLRGRMPEVGRTPVLDSIASGDVEYVRVGQMGLTERHANCNRREVFFVAGIYHGDPQDMWREL